MFVTKLKCIRCGKEYSPRVIYKCEKCGNILDIDYDYTQLLEMASAVFKRKEMGVWKYREFLPVVDHDKIVSLKEGGTPLLNATSSVKSLESRIFI